MAVLTRPGTSSAASNAGARSATTVPASAFCSFDGANAAYYIKYDAYDDVSVELTCLSLAIWEVYRELCALLRVETFFFFLMEYGTPNDHNDR